MDHNPILPSIKTPREKNLTLLNSNHEVADRPAHSLSLISVYVIQSMESPMVKMASFKVLIF